MNGVNEISKLFLWSLVAVWMAVIFIFSAQDAKKSSEISGSVIRKTAEIVVPKFRELQPARQEQIVTDWQHTVRKTAHVLTYLALGILSMIALTHKEQLTLSRVFKSIALCIAYAIFDEFHQVFVDGRSGQFSDIGLDFIGALIGILIITLPRAVKNRKVKR